MTLAEVRLWGRTIGAVSLEDGGRFAAFQYDPAFVGSGIELSPITMPLSNRVYVFPDLPDEDFSWSAGSVGRFVTGQVRASVLKWPDFAEQAQVMSDWRRQIQRNHRLEFPHT